MADFCAHANEPLNSITGSEFLYCQLLKKDSVAWNVKPNFEINCFQAETKSVQCR
jgi:hypothetical protein